jgi:hypothetical protein
MMTEKKPRKRRSPAGGRGETWKPAWTACRRWALPPGGEWSAHVDVIGPAAERLDVLDFGDFPCPGGTFTQLQPPRFILREELNRVRILDRQTKLEVWSRGWVPATEDEVRKSAAAACTGMNDRLLQEIAAAEKSRFVER